MAGLEAGRTHGRTAGTAADGATAGTDRTALAAEYATAVLALVRLIPAARAMTYGLVAEVVAESLHRGGPRQVGQVLAGSSGVDDDGAPVPWWRVVNAAGSPPAHHLDAALTELRAEGCPLSRDGRRVDLRRAVWFPESDTPER
ncbi:MGMT family protein [Cellulosimicrobium sp. NPDC055967]|uniref:MGMT family protein n=1 Tax=Cellulosimicrobium sp. NPDC055967 TaxID=3345670 RepID=UPI0035D59E71